MTTTSIPASAAIVAVEPVFSKNEQLALAGFLTGCTGLTLRRTRWTCASSQPGASGTRLRLFAVWRADIECFARA